MTAPNRRDFLKQIGAGALALSFSSKVRAGEPKPVTLDLEDLHGLKDQEEKTLDEDYLKAHLAEKNIILFFGFPGCPALCTPALKNITKAIKDSGKEIAPLFITIQPGYTPQDVKEWFAEQGLENVIGLTEGDNATANKTLAAIRERFSARVFGGGAHVALASFINPQGKRLAQVKVMPDEAVLSEAIEKHFAETAPTKPQPEPEI